MAYGFDHHGLPALPVPHGANNVNYGILLVRNLQDEEGVEDFIENVNHEESKTHGISLQEVFHPTIEEPYYHFVFRLEGVEVDGWEHFVGALVCQYPGLIFQVAYSEEVDSSPLQTNQDQGGPPGVSNLIPFPLPIPICSLGYPVLQVEEILGSRIHAFNDWFIGQTGAVCDGRRYNYDTREYEPTGCGPHGPVVYTWDLKQFLKGLPDLEFYAGGGDM